MKSKIVGSIFCVAAYFLTVIVADAKPWTLNLGNYGTAVVSDGKYLYVVEGSGSSFARSGIERVDLESGNCIELPVNLIPRRFHAAILIDREIYIFGGEAEEGCIATCQSVNLDTLVVKRLGAMPTKRRGLSAVIAGGLIYTIGGSESQWSDHFSREATVEVYDPALKKWYQGKPMPAAKEVPAILAGKYIYTMGGYNGGGQSLSTCARYDLENGFWSVLPDAPFQLSACSATNIGRAIVFFGTYDKISQVVAYIPKTGVWVELKIPFTPRRHSSACTVGGKVYVVGGVTESPSSGMTLIEQFSVADLERAIVTAVTEKTPR